MKLAQLSRQKLFPQMPEIPIIDSSRAFTRKDIARIIANDYSIHRKTAAGIVNAVLDAIVIGLTQTGRVALRDFGVLEVRTRKPHIGRNPRKPHEADIMVPARQIVRFKTGRSLDAKLNSE